MYGQRNKQKKKMKTSDISITDSLIASLLLDCGIQMSMKLFNENYDQPSRHYHTKDHALYVYKRIAQLENVEPGRFSHTEFEALYIAALFHDFILDPREDDNEFQSAELLKTIATDEKNPIIQKACEIILATASHEKSDDELVNLFNAIDMEILSRSTAIELLEYENLIMKEYQFVDYDLYKTERLKFLRNSLNGYHTSNNYDNINILIDWVEKRKLKIGIYAGSFNPFHIGHKNVLQKGQTMFDKVIVSRGTNPDKTDKTVRIGGPEAQKLSERLGNVQVETFEGLLTNHIKHLEEHLNAEVFLIRGIRDGFDLTYENRQIQIMKDSYPELKVVYIPCDRQFDHISSSMIRQMEKFDKELAENYKV